MPRTETVLQAFVASPEDVGEERVMLEEVITESTEEEPGFLDAILIGQDRFQELNIITGRMTDVVNELGAKFRERTTEMESLSEDGRIIDLKAALRISNRLAADMDDFSSRMDVELPLYSKVSRTAIESMTQAANLLGDFGTKPVDEIQGVLEAVTVLLDGINQLREGNIQFMSMIEHLPRVTSTFHKARRRTYGVLKKLDIEVVATQNLTMELEKLLKDLLKKT